MWKPVKEVALKILNNGRVYITQSIITCFFSHGPCQPRYNGVAVYHSVCSYIFLINASPKLMNWINCFILGYYEDWFWSLVPIIFLWDGATCFTDKFDVTSRSCLALTVEAVWLRWSLNEVLLCFRDDQRQWTFILFFTYNEFFIDKHVFC